MRLIHRPYESGFQPFVRLVGRIPGVWPQAGISRAFGPQFRAKGPAHTSLGQRPRTGREQNGKGPTARFIFATLNPIYAGFQPLGRAGRQWSWDGAPGWYEAGLWP